MIFVVRSSSGLQNQGSKILIVIINFKETEQKAFKFTTRLFSYQPSHEKFYLNFYCVSPAILSKHLNLDWQEDDSRLM